MSKKEHKKEAPSRTRREPGPPAWMAALPDDDELLGMTVGELREKLKDPDCLCVWRTLDGRMSVAVGVGRAAQTLMDAAAAAGKDLAVMGKGMVAEHAGPLAADLSMDQFLEADPQAWAADLEEGLIAVFEGRSKAMDLLLQMARHRPRGIPPDLGEKMEAILRTLSRPVTDADRQRIRAVIGEMVKRSLQ